MPWVCGGGLPAQIEAEASDFRHAGEVPVGMELVAGLVVVRGVVFALLLDAPLRVMSLELHALVDGEGGDADAGKAEVVGAVVVAGGRVGVGLDGEVELAGGGLDDGIEGGALGAGDLDLLRDAVGRKAVEIQAES